MMWPRLRALALLAGLAAFIVLFAVRDAPSQFARVRADHAHLASLDNEARRAEMFYADPAQQKVVRRYFAFLEDIRRLTPPEARIGLSGLPAKPLYKFTHYYLYPRHPFALDGDDAPADPAALRLDYTARFPETGRNWIIQRVD